MRFLFPFLLVASSLVHAAFTPLQHVAVIVDDSVILESDVEKRLRDVQFQFAKRNAALPPEEVLRKQIIEQLVMESLQANLAERAGIRIEDAALTTTLTGIAKESGLTLTQFQQQLDSTPGTSYSEVREQVKREMMINRLRQRRMQDRIRITDQDIQNFLKSPAGQAETAQRISPWPHPCRNRRNGHTKGYCRSRSPSAQSTGRAQIRQGLCTGCRHLFQCRNSPQRRRSGLAQSRAAAHPVC
jgi:parvulin-like peptidyl-prolyl isomerase